MKSLQSINLLRDKIITFSGEDVINDSTQDPISSTSVAPITVNMYFMNITDGAIHSQLGVQMNYNSEADLWYVDVSSVQGVLSDRCKYTALIKDASNPVVMRQFRILEFSVDNEVLEDVMMRLPYEIKQDGSEMWMVWYDSESNMGNTSHAVYKAKAYEGGAGTTFARDPSRVTHRGAIVPY